MTHLTFVRKIYMDMDIALRLLRLCFFRPILYYKCCQLSGMRCWKVNLHCCVIIIHLRNEKKKISSSIQLIFCPSLLNNRHWQYLEHSREDSVNPRDRNLPWIPACSFKMSTKFYKAWVWWVKKSKVYWQLRKTNNLMYRHRNCWQ